MDKEVRRRAISRERQELAEPWISTEIEILEGYISCALFIYRMSLKRYGKDETAKATCSYINFKFPDGKYNYRARKIEPIIKRGK